MSVMVSGIIQKNNCKYLTLLQNTDQIIDTANNSSTKNLSYVV